MKPYSLDLRQKIIEAYENQEGSQRELARRFKVSLSFIQSLLKSYRKSGDIIPRQVGQRFSYQVSNQINTSRGYSSDLRQKIIEAHKNQEGSQRELARRFKVSPTFVRNLLNNYQPSKHKNFDK